MKVYKKDNLKIFDAYMNDGSQIKYKTNDNKWIKINNVGCEGLSESIASHVLNCSELPNDIWFVNYEECKIEGINKECCISDNFLKKNEELITFEQLYRNCTGNDIINDIFAINNIQDRFNHVVDFIKVHTSLDVTNYMKTIITLDAFLLNPDRHYGNLCLIYNEDIGFKIGPIFDNGQSLCANFSITPPYLSIEEKIKRLTSITISGSFEMAMMEVGIGMRINFDRLEEKIEGYSKNIPLETLRYQIDRYRDLLKINDKVNEMDSH